jgi:hypothetical protein
MIQALRVSSSRSSSCSTRLAALGPRNRGYQNRTHQSCWERQSRPCQAYRAKRSRQRSPLSTASSVHYRARRLHKLGRIVCSLPAGRVPGCSDVRCCPPQVSWTAAQLDEPAAAGGLTGRLPPCSLAHCPLAPTSDTQMSCTSGGKRDACRHIRRGLSNGFVQILNPSPPGTACPSPRPQYEYYILPHYATIASTRPPAPLAPIHRLTRVRASGLPRRCQDCSPSLAPQSLPVAVSSPWAA